MRNLKDTFRHKGMRARLVQSLRTKGVGKKAILEAIGNLPRHFFLDPAFEEWAYQDKAFQIGCAQTISQPYTVAYQTALLDVKPEDVILEIGTGSGYQAAILYQLGATVHTLERHKPLHLKAKALLNHLAFENIFCYHRDGHKGLIRYAPYDKILFTAGAAELPLFLVKQLAVGGKMVVPVGAKSQTMVRLTKTDKNNAYEIEEFDTFKFVPFQKGIQ